jgi:hypothetical protein
MCKAWHQSTIKIEVITGTNIRTIPHLIYPERSCSFLISVVIKEYRWKRVPNWAD